MSWVMLSLRKKELKQSHSDYVAQDLQISRQERQMSRRYQYEQTLVQNDQNDTLRELKASYNDQTKQIRDAMSSLRESANSQGEKTEDGQATSVDLSTLVDGSNKTINDYQAELDAAKEEYQEQVNLEKTYWEDELAMIEEEANDQETVLEQEKVNAETQMEHISQELSAVDQAISSEIQNCTIKLS